MATIYTRSHAMDDSRIPLGRRLYRIFLLSALFGVLWAKGYLWTIFLLALVLYLIETILLPALEMEAARKAEVEPEPEPPPRRGGGRTRWEWTPEDAP
jgi:hypothetical protein